MKLMPLTPGQVSTISRPSAIGNNGTNGGMTNNAAAAAFVFNSGAVAAADLFWRYHHHHPHHGGAFNFPPSPTLLPPTPFPSPLDFKHHLPANLSECCLFNAYLQLGFFRNCDYYLLSLFFFSY